MSEIAVFHGEWSAVLNSLRTLKLKDFDIFDRIMSVHEKVRNIYPLEIELEDYPESMAEMSAIWVGPGIRVYWKGCPSPPPRPSVGTGCG